MECCGKCFRVTVCVSSILVFVICLYAFLLGNGVITKSFGFACAFENEPISWYFLAKGIFCSLALWLLSDVLTVLKTLKPPSA